MKSLVALFAVFLSFNAFADVSGFECKRGADTLAFKYNVGHETILYGLKLNNSHSSEGHEVFNELLKSSADCSDLASKLPIAWSEVLLCGGEMIVPNGIYGQVILSEGGLHVLKNKIAPYSGWNCN